MAGPRKILWSTLHIFEWNSAKIPSSLLQVSICLGIEHSAWASLSIKWIKHGKVSQVSPKSMTPLCNKWWKREGIRRVGGKVSGQSLWILFHHKQIVSVSLVDCSFDCFCSWILFFQLCLSPPSPSLLLYASSSTDTFNL